MNTRIRSMIDEIFSEMKMTAENLALRDELLSNAQARYEDVMSQGKSEEEAFVEVAASLEDVHALLEEMNGKKAQPEKEAPKESESAGGQRDLSGTLNKAFSALGDFSQAIMPEAKKFYGQMDEVTGGMLGKLGRAAKKGMRDAQKAAGEAIDKLSKESGELVFDFGANKEAKPEEKAEEKREEKAEEFVSDFAGVTTSEPEKPEQADGELVLDMDALSEEPETDADAQRMAALEAEAKEMEAQAAIKAVTGDEAGAEELRMRAQALYMEAALLSQRQESEPVQDAEPAQEAIEDEQAFAKEMDDLVQEAQDVLDEQEQPQAQEAEYVVRDACEPVSGSMCFPAAGLRRIDVQLDADDVEITVGEGTQVETVWEAKNADSEPMITCEGHTLTIRRKNPDAFKTFFSVFQKDGGRITVRVPRGYAADYVISTTSGDVHIGDVDVDNVKISTTSGCVNVEPDARVRAADLSVTTVSGRAVVSACADTVAVKTVSGGQYISCDARRVDVNVVSGKVLAEGACDEWEVSVVSGDVQLRCTTAPAKKVKISSVHADVRLALPGGIRGFVAEATGALGCEIINEFGPNRYGTCALPIRMESMRGKLIISKI